VGATILTAAVVVAVLLGIPLSSMDVKEADDGGGPFGVLEDTLVTAVLPDARGDCWFIMFPAVTDLRSAGRGRCFVVDVGLVASPILVSSVSLVGGLDKSSFVVVAVPGVTLEDGDRGVTTQSMVTERRGLDTGEGRAFGLDVDFDSRPSSEDSVFVAMLAVADPRLLRLTTLGRETDFIIC
jgi:hypothetical protein